MGLWKLTFVPHQRRTGPSPHPAWHFLLDTVQDVWIWLLRGFLMGSWGYNMSEGLGGLFQTRRAFKGGGLLWGGLLCEETMKDSKTCLGELSSPEQNMDKDNLGRTLEGIG